jgi:hypothetical protein
VTECVRTSVCECVCMCVCERGVITERWCLCLYPAVHFLVCMPLLSPYEKAVSGFHVVMW